MAIQNIHKVVFDCNIFAQALMNPTGHAGVLVQAAFDGRVTLFISDFVISEIRDIPAKPTPAKAGVTAKRAEDLVQLLLIKAEYVHNVPLAFAHPIDEDDSNYVNLALASDVKLIVSRDRHLLNLNNATKPWSADFRARYPDLHIISVEQMLMEIRQADGSRG